MRHLPGGETLQLITGQELLIVSGGTPGAPAIRTSFDLAGNGVVMVSPRHWSALDADQREALARHHRAKVDAVTARLIDPAEAIRKGAFAIRLAVVGATGAGAAFGALLDSIAQLVVWSVFGSLGPFALLLAGRALRLYVQGKLRHLFSGR